MNIINYLNNHPRLNYFQRCIRHLTDIKFVNEVLDIGKNPLRLNIQEIGKENVGQLIYICQTMGCDGFFAELRFIMHELFFAERFGLLPVVKMPQNSYYAENEPINGTTNPFEYYFQPVSEISLASAEKSCALVEHNWYQRQYIKKIYNLKSGYLPSDLYLKEMARLVNKYIKFNSIMNEYLNKETKKILNNTKTLGVHVRGSDFKRHYINHPNIVTIDEYLEETSKIMENNKYSRIFIATDDIDALKRFSSVFKEKLSYYDDVIRTDSDETVMRSDSERNMHHFLLGREVIRDMVTLSRCDGIVAGLSNVSIFARIMKLSTGNDFLNMNYINKGINA